MAFPFCDGYRRLQALVISGLRRNCLVGAHGFRCAWVSVACGRKRPVWQLTVRNGSSAYAYCAYGEGSVHGSVLFRRTNYAAVVALFAKIIDVQYVNRANRRVSESGVGNVQSDPIGRPVPVSRLIGPRRFFFSDWLRKVRPPFVKSRNPPPINVPPTIRNQTYAGVGDSSAPFPVSPSIRPSA